MVETICDWLRGSTLADDLSTRVEDAVQAWSGRAWAEEVAGVAALLAAAGVRRGDRVAVLLPRGLEEVACILGAMAVGAVAVPIHTRLKDEQVAHVLQDAAPRCCVVSAARLLALQDPRESLAGVPHVDPGARRRAPAGASFCGDLRGADTAVILYTSGSTGRAKGIVQTHENLVAGARIVAGFLDLTPADRLLSLLSLSFDYGLNQVLTALASGCRLAVGDHLGAGELALLLQRHRPTGLAGVPSFWHEAARGLESGALTAADGASLRFVTNSGGKLQPADSAVLRARWPGAEVFAMYGLTEAFRSAYLPPAELDEAPDSFGYAIEGVELLLVDAHTGAVLRGPAEGELVHAGALVAQGYWNNPEATAARFRRDPRGGDSRVVYSGDLVRRDARGRHFFVSRMDRMMKVHGHRVSPDEVSREVVGAPGVGRVAVFGVPDGARGDRIAVFCEGEPGDPALADRVRRRCRARLPSYMQPSVVRVLARLPLNPNGKVDEAALRGML
ncbi:MAG: AMP-binding protein [Planctomycetota bacterium]